MTMAKMHQTVVDHTIWERADKSGIRGTDKDLAEAENWTPPK